MTSVKGKGEGSFYNICAGAHEGEGEGPAEKRRARRRRGGKGAGTEARAGGGGNGQGGEGKRHWVTGKKVPGCMIREPARNDNGGRPY